MNWENTDQNQEMHVHYNHRGFRVKLNEKLVDMRRSARWARFLLPTATVQEGLGNHPTGPAFTKHPLCVSCLRGPSRLHTTPLWSVTCTYFCSQWTQVSADHWPSIELASKGTIRPISALQGSSTPREGGRNRAVQACMKGCYSRKVPGDARQCQAMLVTRAQVVSSLKKGTAGGSQGATAWEVPWRPLKPSRFISPP